MKVTYLGTTMLLMDDGETQILFDCHVSRPSLTKYLLGTIKTDEAVARRVLDDFPMDRLQAMFISHSHHDHAMDIPFFANRCDCAVYGTSSTLNIARGGDVPERNLWQYAHGQAFDVGAFKITVLKSLHSKPSFFNNNLGQTIDAPLCQPAKASCYKEGGSFDFVVEHAHRTYLIRPSYNFIPGQLDGIQADVLFLGIAGLAGDNAEHKAEFWRQTLDKVRPQTVVPLHWDNFFRPLYAPLIGLPRAFEFTGAGMHELALACSLRGIDCVVQLPLTSMEL